MAANTIEEFRTYLNGRIKYEHEQQNEKARNKWGALRDIRTMLEGESEDNDKIFNGYDFLSEELFNSPFTYDEITDIIFYYVGKNVKRGILDKDNKIGWIDLDNIKIYQEEIRQEFINLGISSISDLNRLPEEKVKELNEKAKEKCFLDLEKSDSELSRSIKESIEAHHELETHYLDKQGKMTEEDLDAVIDNLRKLKVTPSILNEIRWVLEKRMTNKKAGTIETISKKYLSTCGEVCYNAIESKRECRNLKDIEFIKDALTNLGRFNSFIKYPATMTKEKVYLLEFSIVEYLSSKARANISEQLAFIMYIIERNIDTGILEDQSTPKPIEITEYMQDLELKLLDSFYPGHFANDYARFIAEFMQSSISGKSIMNYSPNTSFEDVQNAHEMIRVAYLNKLDTYEEKDIETVERALVILGISPNQAVIYKESLLKALNKRRTSQLEERETPKVERVLKPIVNKKTYYTVYNTMLHYFDFDKMTPFRFLTLDEIIYVIALANKIYLDRDQIDEFIRKTYAFNRTYHIKAEDAYKELRRKMEYYKDNEDISKILEEIDFVFGLMGKKDQDYNDLEEYMNMELKDAVMLLGEHFEYEYDEASKISIDEEELQSKKDKM